MVWAPALRAKAVVETKAMASEPAPEPPEVFIVKVMEWLVCTLYLDEAVPKGPLLQYMVRLLLGVELSSQQLRNCIEAAPGLSLDPPNARKFLFTAVLNAPPKRFKGFQSESSVSADDMSDEMFQEVSVHLARGGWPQAADVAHKHFVVTSWLQSASEKLLHVSFGRLLAIVKSSVTSLGLLGTKDGFIVPYALSEQCERRINACTGQPTGVAPGETYIKQWDELIDLLKQLIVKSGHEQCVEVSRLKCMMRQEFKTELSETVFGHQSLSKLLADPRLEIHFAHHTAIEGHKNVLMLRNAASKPTQDHSLDDPIEQYLPTSRMFDMPVRTGNEVYVEKDSGWHLAKVGAQMKNGNYEVTYAAGEKQKASLAAPPGLEDCFPVPVGSFPASSNPSEPASPVNTTDSVA